MTFAEEHRYLTRASVAMVPIAAALTGADAANADIHARQSHGKGGARLYGGVIG
jgi:hypothetical protein